VEKMKNMAILLVILSLASCVGAGHLQGPQKRLNPVPREVAQKSPHGYVVGGDPERFGGFVGDCTSEKNFRFYWKCQSENAGNDFH